MRRRRSRGGGGDVGTRLSLVRLVLRPREIVRYGPWTRVVVPCAAVRRVDRPMGCGVPALETRTGEVVSFFLLYGSLWDALYDFTAVCVDALRAHVRRYGGESAANGIERRSTWSPVADALTVCTVVWALNAAVRTAAG